MSPNIVGGEVHRIRADRHELYVREFGNPTGTPVVIIHGGPGAGSDPTKAELFDLQRCRVLLPDQRGAGLSTPAASNLRHRDELSDNTMSALIDDLTLIKQELRIDQPWIVAGNSFGSTLGISYAAKNSHDVAGMLLWSIYLCRDKDFEYMWEPTGYSAHIRSRAYDEFVGFLGPGHRHDAVLVHAELMWSEDRATREDAAWSWEMWNRQLYYSNERPKPVRTAAEIKVALTKARLFQHYRNNKMFLPQLFGESAGNNQLAEVAQSLPDIPIALVHGGRDLATPFDGAVELQRALNARGASRVTPLTCVKGASHSSSEPGFLDALQAAAIDIQDAVSLVAEVRESVEISPNTTNIDRN